MKDEEQDQKFLELVQELFKKSRVRNRFRHSIDKFYSNLYSRYYHLFHPSKYLTLKSLMSIFGSTEEINSEELKTNEVELVHQAHEMLRSKHNPCHNSPTGIEVDFARLTKILVWEEVGRQSIDWNEFSNYTMFFTDIEIIRRFKENLNWEKLVDEPQLPWSIDFISEFEKYLFIDMKYQGYTLRSVFSHVPSVPWSEELFDKYYDYWDWNYLSFNKGIKWTEEIIIKYSDKWDWKELSANPNIIMTEKLLTLFHDKWWDWEKLGSNPNIKWTDNLITKVRWGSVWKGLSRNPSLKWGLNLIKKYENSWDWETLSKSELIPWDMDLIKEFREKWDWFKLCMNPSIKWDRQLIDEFKEEVEWYALGLNIGLTVSDNDIEFYQNNWRWDTLCANESVVIDGNFLRKHRSHINFQGHISYGAGGKDHYWIPQFLKNKNLNIGVDEIRNLSIANQWQNGYVYCNENPNEPGEWVALSRIKNLTQDILTEFQEYLDWDVLSANEFLPCDVDLVLHFKDLWNWEIMMDNETFWCKIIEPNLKIMNLKYINDMFRSVYLNKIP